MNELFDIDIELTEDLEVPAIMDCVDLMNQPYEDIIRDGIEEMGMVFD